MNKISVILDTDIGDDIDDTWALVMMLKSSQLDPKYILTAYGDTTYRAKLVSKLLTVANRTEIPVGIGENTIGKEKGGRQSDSLKGFDYQNYKGELYENGIEKMIEIIMNSEKTITIIAIGPLTNIRKALEIEPMIAEKCKFVGMLGGVYKGYKGSPKVIPEYNVRCDVKACETVFSADWKSITITPLDTCGTIKLKGERFLKIYNHQDKDPLIRELLETSRIWSENIIYNCYSLKKPKTSVLFDTAAIYLCFSEELVVIKEIPLRIKKSGLFKVEKKEGKGNLIRCAIDWKELEKFLDLLVEIYTNS